MRRSTPAGQYDLLSWQAPEPVMRFDPADVQAATVSAQLGAGDRGGAGRP